MTSVGLLAITSLKSSFRVTYVPLSFAIVSGQVCHSPSASTA